MAWYERLPLYDRRYALCGEIIEEYKKKDQNYANLPPGALVLHLATRQATIDRYEKLRRDPFSLLLTSKKSLEKTLAAISTK